MGPTLMLAKCLDEEKSIKQGYNTLSNYAVSYFSFVGFAVFTHQHGSPLHLSLSLPKINYLGAIVK